MALQLLFSLLKRNCKIKSRLCYGRTFLDDCYSSTIKFPISQCAVLGSVWTAFIQSFQDSLVYW